MQKITIIGGGATGILLAVNLLKFAENLPLEINIVEKKGRFGLGVAYSTTSDFHLLNVTAGNMSAFPDDSKHLCEWLSKHSHNYLENDFVPRKIFGEYLSDVFLSAFENKSPNTTVNLFNDEAVNVNMGERFAEVKLNSGKIIESDKVVLAFGNFLPTHPNVSNTEFIKSDKYSQNPWDNDFFQNLNLNDEVLLIGTGLTMVDAVLNLHNNQHRGKIIAVSRHGLLPATHKLGFDYSSFENEILQEINLLKMLKLVRKHIAKAQNENSDWRAVIDSLRPITQIIWQKLSRKEKRRFLRHLSHYWSVSRSRIPAQCAKVLETLKSIGQLEIKHGKIRKITTAEDKRFAVTYGETTIYIDAIINCTGPQTNFERLEIPLVKNLIRKGLVRSDSLSIGLDASPNGEIIDEFGKINERLFTIGTALRGILWETIAIPEISYQAKELALRFLQKTNSANI